MRYTGARLGRRRRARLDRVPAPNGLTAWIAATMLGLLPLIAGAVGLAIESFETDGRMIFSGIHGASGYRVESVMQLGGEWTTVSNGLDAIPAGGSGSVTCTVPLEAAAQFFREVATVTNLSMVPVQGVNWYDCVKWCNARSEREGRTPVYYADAGYSTVYLSGQVLAPYVDSLANGYGLYEMAGNVSEWCFDWSPGYISRYRTVRGGSWSSSAPYCRVAQRSLGSPNGSNSTYGLRTVRNGE